MNNSSKQVLIFLFGIIAILVMYFGIVRTNIEPFDSNSFISSLHMRYK